MRAGGPNCTIQQYPLTSEAAAVVKQAMTLAKNRGHSQVTPLHMASTLLSSNPISNGNNGNVTGILRTACLRSHSHPLQCRALELCLNVALNRLPAVSTVQFGDDYFGSAAGGGYPSVSNALVASFKRAHAHQRRGSVENQANTVMSKIELDQLVVSILDDPSVSRVMKEAGFSSSQVKNNVERTVCSEKNDSETYSPSIRSEDIEYVVGNLVGGRRKNFVIIGESLGTAEGIVRKVMERIENGEVPQNLRGLRTLDVSLASAEHLTKEEIATKLKEINNHAKGRLILHVGGLEKWMSRLEKVTIEDTSAPSRLNPPKEQSPILHLAMEIGRMIHEDREYDDEYGINIQLIGFATISCYQESRKSGDPSLETLWGLSPLNIHRNELEIEIDRNTKIKESGDESCWLHLLPKDKQEKTGRRSSFVNGLPPWLQQYKDEINVNKDYQGYDGVMEEYNNTSPISFKHPKFMSLPPSPSTNSDFSLDHQRHNHDWPLTNQSRWSLNFRLSNSKPNSTSSSDDAEFVAENVTKFMEINAENLKNLCCELEDKLPSHKDVVIPKIARTVLRCRPGMLKRKGLSSRLGGRTKNGTWMVFSGADIESMRKMARELARVIFRSYGNFVSFSVIEDESVFISKKRTRDEDIQGRFERFWESIRGDPRRVFFVEDVEKADSCSLMALRKSMETGKVESLFGGEVGIGEAIVILSYRGHVSLRSSRNDGNCTLLDLNRVIEDEEDEGINNQSVVIDDVGILDCVDEVIMFD